jgi:cell division protein FtsL
VVVVCGVVLALTIVAFHAFLAQNQVRLGRIRGDIAAAEARYDQARLENSELSSPERITEAAGRQGLVVPDVAPVAVPIAGAVPKRGSSSDVIENYQEVKGHLDASP